MKTLYALYVSLKALVEVAVSKLAVGKLAAHNTL